MKAIIAKFYVNSVQHFGQPNPTTGEPETTGVTVTLQPVSYKHGDESHENSKFWHASPSGKMELYIQNPQAFDFFKQGEEIYLPMVKGLVGLARLQRALGSLNVD